jgi:hypothetical protein
MKMKNLLPYLLILCFKASAQDVSGLFSGTLVNDSTKKIQNYELALSEYKGKITGYAYTTFVVNDTFYYSIKRVKATKANGTLIVEDVKMLANNFPAERSKGVRVVNTIPLQQQDSIMELKGTWRTNQTKVYYSVYGALDLKKNNDSLRSPLINHLYDLDVLERTDPVYVNNTVKGKEKTEPAAKSEAVTKSKSVIENKPATAKRKDVAPVVIPAENRNTTVLQTIDVVTDSLVLSFYDNGIVDGDIISVDFNGQNVISKTRLTAVAAKRSLLLRSADSDTYQLTLIAENLGSIPPNTGLLVVQDGKNRYDIHFTADLQTNAAVVFRRKK